MINGFLRVAAVSPKLHVADVYYNVAQIISEIEALDALGVEIAVFPELCITGYTCGDLFHNSLLLDAAYNGLNMIAERSRDMDIDVIVGLPVRREYAVYNCAAFVHKGEVQMIDKTYIPNYNEFYERRWFAPASENTEPRMFMSHGVKVGIEICEDLWVPIPPSCRMAMSGAQVIFNLSASNDLIGKHEYLLSLIKQQSARCMCAYVYASSGCGESSTDLVFLPKTVIAENGTLLVDNNRDVTCSSNNYVIADIDIAAIDRDRMHTTTFYDCAHREGCTSNGCMSSNNVWRNDYLPEYRTVHRHPFVPPTDDAIDERCGEIILIQEAGLSQRLSAIHGTRLVVGISGGLDSTLALLVAVKTFDRLGFDRRGIVAVTMPGFGTTDRTYRNAMKLMEYLGVTIREISIKASVTQHFSDIGHDASIHDVTYENSQARERTQILMDIANQQDAIVLGTGDLSELALGWATYNGDHMSMYGVNAGVPKTLVRYLVRWFAMRSDDNSVRSTLEDIIDTPISPELTPADDKGNIQQKTEELVGPYELSDFYLYYMLRFGYSPRRIMMLARKAFGDDYDYNTMLHWMKRFYTRFFSQQFKRSCLPDAPKVGSVCLSPRGDWRMPSDASSALWLSEIDEMESEME